MFTDDVNLFDEGILQNMIVKKVTSSVLDEVGFCHIPYVMSDCWQGNQSYSRHICLNNTQVWLHVVWRREYKSLQRSTEKLRLNTIFL